MIKQIKQNLYLDVPYVNLSTCVLQNSFCDPRDYIANPTHDTQLGGISDPRQLCCLRGKYPSRLSIIVPRKTESAFQGYNAPWHLNSKYIMLISKEVFNFEDN